MDKIPKITLQMINAAIWHKQISNIRRCQNPGRFSTPSVPVLARSENTVRGGGTKTSRKGKLYQFKGNSFMGSKIIRWGPWP